MRVEEITSFMAGVILVEMVVATLSLGYVIGVFLRARSRDSVIFKMLVGSDIVKVIAGVWIGFLAIYRLADFGVGLPVWTSPISAVVVGILLAPPILHALVFRRLRRRYGDGTPPPFHMTD